MLLNSLKQHTVRALLNVQGNVIRPGGQSVNKNRNSGVEPYALKWRYLLVGFKVGADVVLNLEG